MVGAEVVGADVDDEEFGREGFEDLEEAELEEVELDAVEDVFNLVAADAEVEGLWEGGDAGGGVADCFEAFDHGAAEEDDGGGRGG